MKLSIPLLPLLFLSVSTWLNFGVKTVRSETRKNIAYWPDGMEPYDAVRFHGNRTRRQLSSLVNSLAVPPHTIISIAPRFGWLLYQGSDVEEELDFVLQSEFIYRFPQQHASEEESGREHEERGREEEGAEHDRMSMESYGRDPYMYVDEMASSSNQHSILNFDHNWRLHSQMMGSKSWSPGASRRRRDLSTVQEKRNSRMVLDKVTLYRTFENLLTLLGVDGRACLLQAICEISAKPLLYDGVVGELLNLLLVPSHTNGHHHLLEEFLLAEQPEAGKTSCSSRYPSCRLSIFEHSSSHLS